MKNNYKNNLNKAARTTTVDTWLAIIHFIRRSSKSFKSPFVATSLLKASSNTSFNESVCAWACFSGTPASIRRLAYFKVSKVIMLMVKLSCLTLRVLYHKSKKLFYALLTAILLTSTTQALVVTDPTSYGYYVEQLKTYSKQLTEAKNLGKSTDGIIAGSQEIFDFANSIEGNFKKELATYNDYRNLLSVLQRKKLDSY